MSKHARRPKGRKQPSLSDCVFHRCARHDLVPALNFTEEQTHSECGACVAEGLLAVKAQLVLALEGYADRLTYSHALQVKLDAARARLNILSPGAGDFLDKEDEDDVSGENGD